jgi:hypothetical protein
MADKKIDVTSDAARSDPTVADKARKDLSENARRGLREAARETRYREDVDTSKTPEEEREAPRTGQGYPGATTK